MSTTSTSTIISSIISLIIIMIINGVSLSRLPEGQQRKEHEGGEEERPEGDQVFIPVSVKKTILRKRRQVGKSDLKAPNLGLNSSFCCWAAWPRLT